MTLAATCAVDEESLCCAVTVTYDYDAFGNKINSQGPHQTTTFIAANSSIQTSACIICAPDITIHSLADSCPGSGGRIPISSKHAPSIPLRCGRSNRLERPQR
jgi:hypothetical protein